MLWEDLTASEFKQACETTKGTCIIPFGVIEKHGGHLPLGTDMLAARWIAEEAAKLEPAVVFPYYYFGQINEARHVPGTIAVDPMLMFNVLENICNEISRNGFKKIVILNSHGGNPFFIKYFMQSTLYKKRDYAVYSIEGWFNEDNGKELKDLLGTDDFGSHAGNLETSMIMAINEVLVKMEQVEADNINALGRLNNLKGIYTSIFWYADHPTHFAGEPFHANVKAGKRALDMVLEKVANDVKRIKEDQTTIALQNEFYAKTNE